MASTELTHNEEASQEAEAKPEPELHSKSESEDELELDFSMSIGNTTVKATRDGTCTFINAEVFIDGESVYKGTFTTDKSAISEVEELSNGLYLLFYVRYNADYDEVVEVALIKMPKSVSGKEVLDEIVKHDYGDYCEYRAEMHLGGEAVSTEDGKMNLSFKFVTHQSMRVMEEDGDVHFHKTELSLLEGDMVMQHCGYRVEGKRHGWHEGDNVDLFKFELG